MSIQAFSCLSSAKRMSRPRPDLGTSAISSVLTAGQAPAGCVSRGGNKGPTGSQVKGNSAWARGMVANQYILILHGALGNCSGYNDCLRGLEKSPGSQDPGLGPL